MNVIINVDNKLLKIYNRSSSAVFQRGERFAHSGTGDDIEGEREADGRTGNAVGEQRRHQPAAGTAGNMSEADSSFRFCRVPLILLCALRFMEHLGCSSPEVPGKLLSLQLALLG